MSIQSEIERLQQAKANLKTAINGKGGNITDDKLDSYYVYVNEINTGSDVSGVTATPADVRNTVKYVTASGELVSGTMPDSTASVADGKVTVTAGYLSADYVYTLPAVEGTDLSFVTAGAGQILSGYVGSDKDGNPINGTITTKTSDDVTFVGGTVEMPPGYYAGVSKSIPVGTTTQNGNIVNISEGWHYDQSIDVGAAYPGGTITPGTEDQIINADSYITSTLTIKGDANWKEENIAEGVTMWGKTGTYKGSGYDTSDATAIAGFVMDGYTFYGADGKETGTLKALSTSDMVIMEDAVLGIPATRHVDNATYSLLNVAGIGDLASENIVEGKAIAGILGSHKCATTEVVAGVLVDDGGTMKVQKLSFDGTTPSDDGDPVTVDSFYTFNTGRDEPVYDSGSTMEIYKCAEVKSQGSILTLSNANNGPGYNGTYVLDSGTGTSRIWRDQTDSTHVVMYNSGYGKWCIGTLPEGYTDSAYLSAHHVANETEPTDPWDCSYTGGEVIDPNTTASWSGYRYNTETKEFADTLTEGLEYKMAAPVVGKCYNADATMLIDLYAPTGLVFYAPLHEEKTTDEMGHNLSFDDYVAVETVKGIQAVKFSGSQGVTCNSGFNFDTSFTVSIMLYQTDTTYRRAFYVDDGQGQAHGALTLQQWGTDLDIGYGGGSDWVVNDPTVPVANIWMTLALVCDRQTVTSQAYKDGILIGSKQFVASTTLLDTIYLGRSRTGSERLSGYIAEVKVWNRVLSADEIKAEADRCLAMVDNSESGSAYGIKFTIDGGDNIPPQFNGTYTQSDVTASGTDRVWTKDDDPVYNVKYYQEDWYLFENDYDFEVLATGENPWDDIVRSGVTVTVIE